MVIAGITCYANRWPKPDTKLALEWTKTDPVRWRATNRPASNDQYFADIEIWDSATVVNALYSALKDPAQYGQITVNLGSGDERYIFGADVTCTIATVMTYGTPTEAGSFKMFSFKLRLKALNPTFTGTAEWPTEMYAQAGWTAGQSWELNKLSSYNNTMTYQNNNAGEGIFEGHFLLFTAGMAKARRNIATIRGQQTTFPEVGIGNPFGATLPGFSTALVRIIEWEDLGRLNYAMWGLRIKLGYDGAAS